MQGWIAGFQESIDYIEQNLTEEIDIEVIAGKAALSSFYYQRIFGALCGMTVSEYYRDQIDLYDEEVRLLRYPHRAAVFLIWYTDSVEA